MSATAVACPTAEALAAELHGHPRFEFVQLLSVGSFGAVALANDTLTGAPVALKFLRRSKNGYAFSESEIINQTRLRLHPHIVALHEVFLTDSYLVLVLEYAPCGDLAKLLQREGPLSEARARFVFQQVLFALEFCHRMGIATRDIKLENVLVLNSGDHPIVKMADFGLSTEVSGPTGAPDRQASGLCGTPLYFAPEMLGASGATYDAKKTDVWACGVLLAKMVSGASPFLRSKDIMLQRKDRMHALLRRIKRVDYVLPEGLSPACQDFLASMLVADPSQRPSVAQLLHHPWCAEGLPPSTVLHFNNMFVERSLANPPPPELVQEVHDILQEACLGPVGHPAVEAAMSPTTPSATKAPGMARAGSTDSDEPSGTHEGHGWSAPPSE